MYLDDIKLFAKNVKDLETLIQTVKIYSQDQNWYSAYKMRHASNEKWQTTHNGRSLTTKSSNQNARKNGNLQIRGRVLEADTIKQQEMKEKFFKSISEELENYSRQNSIAGSLSKG